MEKKGEVSFNLKKRVALFRQLAEGIRGEGSAKQNFY